MTFEQRASDESEGVSLADILGKGHSRLRQRPRGMLVTFAESKEAYMFGAELVKGSAVNAARGLVGGDRQTLGRGKGFGFASE